MNSETLVRCAGMLQLLQSPAIIAGQRSLGWMQELQTLKPLTRRFVYSIAAGIFCYVTGTAILTLIFAKAIASTQLGAALCLLQAIAWTIRAGQQLFGLHPVWSTNARWLDAGMCVTYVSLACLYAGISSRAIATGIFCTLN